MNKNVKRIFFVLTILTLLVAITTVSATNDTCDTSNVISETPAVDQTSSEVISDEVTTTSDNEVKTENNKIIEKEDKKLKTENMSLDEIEYSQTITDQEYNADIEVYGENYYFKNCSINNNYINVDNGGILTLENCVVNTAKRIEIVGGPPSTLNLINTTFNQKIRLIGSNAYCEKINISYAGIYVEKAELPPEIFEDPELLEMLLEDFPDLLTNLGGELIINDSDINNMITGKDAQITCYNSRINNTINGTVNITFDTETVFYSNANINCTNITIDDINRVIPYLGIYNDTYTLSNNIITTEKLNLGNLTILNSTINNKITNKGTLTLNNTTINSTIDNRGVLYIDDDVILGENAQIVGLGTIVTNNITRLLPILEAITGNYTITNITLDKTYKFYGNITLDDSTITSTDNVNYGILKLVNTNVQTDEESNWIINNRILIIDEDSTTTGNIINYGEVYNGNLPEDFSYDPTHHIINNNSISIYLDIIYDHGQSESEEGYDTGFLSDLVKEGDTLDFQGTISHVTRLERIVINKPVNIITFTNDGRIEDFDSITYSNGASGSNVTGLYTYNTQFYVKNAHNMVFDNISNVVNSKRVGGGVGQTSIRENSTNITVKNSYFYTKDNGGSSTFVFGWADNCTLINSTIETDGMVGNLIYLTTYNVYVPDEVMPNSNNQILNNVIIGPDDNSPICWSIVLTGANNTIANNVIYYRGEGIVQQYGSDAALILNNNITNNTHIKSRLYNELIVDTTEFTAGESTTIKASIYYATKINTNITNGKVTFKVNGKTLKDTNGKVIYVKMINGTAVRQQ